MYVKKDKDMKIFIKSKITLLYVVHLKNNQINN